MASTSTETLSFTPWTREANDEGQLKEVLARVNLERGHFRTITEASLQEEIAAEGGLELSESESEDEDDDGEEQPQDVQAGRGKPTTLAEFYKAKNEMLANMRAAEQEILMATDFVSLLLSKDLPKQAQLTASQALKMKVPLGTLGTDVWQRMPVDKAREQQDELLATNVKLKSLQQNADSLLSAANRLHSNVRKETEYWNQILSITEKGWNVSRIPGQRNRLGVRFGFSESAPEFSRKGIAALHASADGTIALERGVGTKPQTLRVLLRKDGKLVGRSSIPSIPDEEETTLEARIRYARDSLFDEELFYEMIRESRTLASLGIGMKGSAINLGTHAARDSGIDASLDLISADEDQDDLASSTRDEDVLAQAIVLAARLLLSQAHRERTKKRCQIPPPLTDEKKADKPVLPILRPITAFIMHRSVLDRTNKSVERLSQMLGAAKIESSHHLGRLNLPEVSDITSAETLISMFMQPWTSKAELTVFRPDSEPLTFGLGVETTLAYRPGPLFDLTSPRSSDRYRFDNLDELILATEAKISSELAFATASQLGNEWEAIEDQGMLERIGGSDGSRGCLWIRVNIEAKEITLNSLNDKTTWRTNDDESSSVAYWDAAQNLA